MTNDKPPREWWIRPAPQVLPNNRNWFCIDAEQSKEHQEKFDGDFGVPINFIHVREVIPGSIQITREMLRVWCMKHFTEDFSIEPEIDWALDELFGSSEVES